MTRGLYKIGKLFATHRWLVLTVWLVILAATVTWASNLSAVLKNNYDIPGTQAQTAQDVLSSDFPQIAGQAATVVFQADSGPITAPAKQQYVAQVLQGVQGLDHVETVTNPYQVANGQMANVSPDGTTALATVYYDNGYQVTTADTGLMTDKINSYESAGQTAGVNVTPGGNTYFTTANTSGDDKKSEVLGVSAAIVILLIAFGSALAMGLPLITALFGLGVGLSVIHLVANWLEVSIIGPTVATMIGLGVGIDYALFVVNRYRENRKDGFDKTDAIGRTTATAGQAVIVAGLTVIIALMGLFLIDIPIISSIAYTAAISVGTAILVAISLMPALLGILGDKIEKANLHHLFKRTGFDHSWANGWAKKVVRYPLWIGLAALIVYVVLIIPVKSIELGPPGENTIPTDNTQRIAYNIISDKYGVGRNGPILLVEQLPTGQSQQQIQAGLTKISQAVQQTSGVASVTYPSLNADKTVAVQAVIPTTSFSSVETEELVNNLQDTVLPKASEGTGFTVQTGGFTATFIDMADKIKQQMPMFIGAVIAVAFLLLVVVFRSLFVPLIAACMIALSALATFGVMVAVFQWGWLSSLIGLDGTGQLVSYVPIMIFAILFGLTMDYEIFLVSRMRESYSETHKNERAVVAGLTRSARIIVAAALIMFCVFASFNTQFSAVIKMFGTGLAVAILIDVFLARMILVPALMKLGGKATWWFPGWLEWIPDMHFEDSSVLDTDKSKKASKSSKARSRQKA